jgi:uncharacterized protein YqeY
VALRQEIPEQTKVALKAGDKTRVSTLRLLSAAIKNREVEAGHELDDDEVRDVAVKEAKKRRESIEAFDKAGRDDLANKERDELAILGPFLPEQFSEAEIDAAVDEAIASTGASSLKDMGKVMGLVMAKAKGKADGGVIQEKVKARLGAE